MLSTIEAISSCYFFLIIRFSSVFLCWFVSINIFFKNFECPIFVFVFLSFVFMDQLEVLFFFFNFFSMVMLIVIVLISKFQSMSQHLKSCVKNNRKKMTIISQKVLQEDWQYADLEMLSEIVEILSIICFRLFV